MSHYWSPLVHRLTPYVPGEQPQIANLIKLNTNENPYGPSPRALAAMHAACNANLRLYSDPHADRLKQAVARNFNLAAHQVFVGNGSDEVLAHAFLALFQHAQPILLPDISYSFYPVYCTLYGIEALTIPLDAALQIRIDDYLQYPANGGIVFANPNAPTGCALPVSEIERLLSHNRDSVVIVDEAYVDFGGESAAKLIERYSNLLVVQTFSKSRALAGLRVGFALGNGDLIEALERVKNSFNSYPLDRIAIAGATAAIEDQEYFAQTCAQVIQNRTQLAQALVAMGFVVLPSASNFLFVRHPQHDALVLATHLRTHNIIVRHFKNPQRIAQFLRITVGTEEQCAALLGIMRSAGEQ